MIRSDRSVAAGSSSKGLIWIRVIRIKFSYPGSIIRLTFVPVCESNMGLEHPDPDHPDPDHPDPELQVGQAAL